MSAQTSIEWTDKTWNPTTGCTKVSPGCKHCYAETVADRFWAKQYPGRKGFTEVRLHPDRLDEPLRWRRPARVFVNSMSDLFHEDIPDEFIAAVFGVMGAAKHHTFQVLTKRPGRMARWMADIAEKKTGLYVIQRSAALHCAVAAQGQFNGMFGTCNPYHLTTNHVWPLPNVHLGISAENQNALNDRWPILSLIPTAVRFLSLEPLLGPIYGVPRADWVIVGGESGPGARPCDVRWIRSIIEQCKAACVPCFVKQLGAKPIRETEDDALWNIGVDRKGGNMNEWPIDLRVREFPHAD